MYTYLLMCAGGKRYFWWVWSELWSVSSLQWVWGKATPSETPSGQRLLGRGAQDNPCPQSEDLHSWTVDKNEHLEWVYVLLSPFTVTSYFMLYPSSYTAPSCARGVIKRSNAAINYNSFLYCGKVWFAAASSLARTMLPGIARKVSKPSDWQLS